MDVAKNIGARIRRCREQAGMTQGELAAAAFVTRQSVGNWEGGKTLPDVQSLQAGRPGAGDHRRRTFGR